ncbi:MAG: Gfo/Idh/MocA family oxidoreductase [Oscillospiraceae bacterium]|nr:Gfo/Idh/MocA family oxidoreductase [Oscillospiraceae bacterium]
MTDLQQIKAGIIGFGGMGFHHGTHLMALADGLELKGVFDTDPERMNLAKERGFSAYSSQEELLADPDISFVVVATPNDFHPAIAEAAMRAGKNVMLEKPATITAGEFEKLIEIAEETGRILTVHQNRRFDSDYLIIKEVLAGGRLGEVFSVHSCVHGSNGIPPGWRKVKRQGGGMLLDWGVHLLDQLLLVIPGKIARVYCTMQTLPDGSDECFDLTLTFESGLNAVVSVGTKNFIPQPRWLVCGNLGAAQVDGWNCVGKVVTVKDTEVYFEPEIVYTTAGPTKTMAPRNKLTVDEVPLPAIRGDEGAFYQTLISALRGKSKPIVDNAEVLRVLRVMEAARTSYETGRAIEFNM